jgi:hypothetical protein
MKTNIIFLTVVITLSLSCKKEQKRAEEITRMERVIAVHDEMMPKMGALGKLISAMEIKIDSASTENEYKNAKEDLEAAYSYMMEWMKGFGERFESDEILEGKALSKQKETWLIEEEAKVNTMKDMIQSSIANAEALLKVGN